MNTPRKVAIIGSGALSSLFAAQLSRIISMQNNELWSLGMIGHWPEQIEAIRRKGLRLIDLDGRMSESTIAIFNETRDADSVDFALVLVKSNQTPKAAKIARKILKTQGVALTLQNGLGNREVLAAALGNHRVFQGVTLHGAYIRKPGEVFYAGTGHTFLQDVWQQDSRLNPFYHLLQSAHLNPKVTKNMDERIWQKLVINSAINPLTALLKISNGALLQEPIARRVMIRTANETLRVAHRLGLLVNLKDPEETVESVCRQTARNQSSMLMDVLRGRQTEIESINGAIIKVAETQGITPYWNTKLFGAVDKLKIDLEFDPTILEGWLEEEKSNVHR